MSSNTLFLRFSHGLQWKMCTIPFVATNTLQSLWALWLCSIHQPSLSAWASPACLSIPVTLPQCCYLTPGSSCFSSALCSATHGSSVDIESEMLYMTLPTLSLLWIELSDINIYSHWVICLATTLQITAKQPRKKKQPFSGMKSAVNLCQYLGSRFGIHI